MYKIDGMYIDAEKQGYSFRSYKNFILLRGMTGSMVSAMIISDMILGIENKNFIGSQLHWNADELTWDCPCHGSRFDYTGHLIEGPVVKNITEE